MIKKALTILAICLLSSFFTKTIAQSKTTKETKVIAVVTDNSITAIELFKNTSIQKEKLIKKHPKSKFYIGLLKGRYELKKQVLIPKNDAVITLFTEKQVFKESLLFKDKKPNQGEIISIGKTKAKVIEVKKGELIIKTYN